MYDVIYHIITTVNVFASIIHKLELSIADGNQYPWNISLLP